MKKLFKRIGNWIKPRIKAITPGKNAISGAAMGLYIFTGILWLLLSVIDTIDLGDPWILVLFLVVALMSILFGYGIIYLLKQVQRIPRNILKALLITLPPILLISGDEPILLISCILILTSIGASFSVLKKTGWNSLTTAKKIVTIVGIMIGLAGLTSSVILYSHQGYEMDAFINAANLTESNVETINAESPAKTGSYAVKTLTYGSGKDKRRIEFGEEADLTTDSVDGTAFIDNWKGIGGWWRKKYWGFDYKALPLNARVWYPEGEGPFPLALVVHGNHGMQDYSDPGYDYLGELLASRGIILASVDENFINGSWTDIFDGLEKENDARGWLLLEHLRQWHEWNRSSENPFHGKVDTTRLALIGHSRGGEAVAHAAMFNALPYYPDDGSIKFDYNFKLRSIIAIAPVDGQYEPGDTRTKFENVSYFVLHGAQDADVRSFMGSQQYERITFTDSLYHFKSGLYIYGANHGQFNTTWGKNDTGHPFTGLLNLKQLLSADDQRQIAKVYISAFLEATLNEKYEYLPLFVDARKGQDWLPKTTFLSQFEDSNTKYVCTFDEDFDITTVTARNGDIRTENLTVWSEQEIQLKWQKKGSRAVFVGWNYDELMNDDGHEDEGDNQDDETESDDNDTDEEEIKTVREVVPDSLIGSYTIHFDPGEFNIDSTSSLVLSIAESTRDSNPKASGKWIEEENNEEGGKENEEEEEADEDEESEKEDQDQDDDDGDDDEEEPEEPLDFTIQMTDTTGQRVELLLSTFSGVQREIEIIIWKVDFIKDDKESEKIFQLFSFPIETLEAINPDFSVSGIEEIKLIFDQSENGVVVIDNIGFMPDLKNYSSKIQ